jgi:hypothetical protein
VQIPSGGQTPGWRRGNLSECSEHRSDSGIHRAFLVSSGRFIAIWAGSVGDRGSDQRARPGGFMVVLLGARDMKPAQDPVSETQSASKTERMAPSQQRAPTLGASRKVVFGGCSAAPRSPVVLRRSDGR